MTSPCGKIRIPINESADDKSQIQEYLVDLSRRGHPAHRARHRRHLRDGRDAARQGRARSRTRPDTYYEQVDTRLPGHGEDVERLRRDRILIDGAPTEGGELLLQIFTADRDRPDLLRDHPAQGQRGLRRGQFPRAVRIDRARPDPPRRAQGLKAALVRSQAKAWEAEQEATHGVHRQLNKMGAKTRLVLLES